MSDKKQFRFIGVKPLTGCAPYISKVLKDNSTYFLYDDYEVDSKDDIKPKPSISFTNDLYNSQKEDDSPLISISAIVGKNGDGKSSIIELIMRVLNNFAYASGYTQNQDDLRPVKDLYAIAYYAIGEEIHTIGCEGNKVTASFLKEELDIKNPQKNTQIIKGAESKLFYTLISNYSMYAYNSNEFAHENLKKGNCWINGIFHKNDAYQTPVVLNPWRHDGNIDINKENYLSKQRLISLFVEEDEEPNSIRKINNKQIAKYLILEPFEESKLSLATYTNYFQHTAEQNNNLLSEQLEEIKLFSEIGAGDKHYTQFQKNHITHLSKLKSLIEAKRADFEFALSHLETDDVDTYNSDLSTYVDELDQLVKANYGFEVSDKNLIDFFKPEYKAFNIQQIQRTMLVIVIRDLWNEKYPNTYTAEEVYKNDLLGKAKQYVIYKTISIIKKYPQYNNIEQITKLESFNFLFKDKIYIESFIPEQRTCFTKLLDDVQKAKSHVSLKLRQTLNFIEHYPKQDYIKESDKNQKLFDSLNIKDSFFTGDAFIIDFQEFKERINKIQASVRKTKESKDFPDNTLEFLPPPLFNTDVVIQQSSADIVNSLLSNLSSGERQLLNSVSSSIYHLQNLNSVTENGLIKYSHANLIFEEIELYFHPEFQRKYIDYLISQIRKINLKRIESINICFVTHSPFILSDIPKENILKLEEGIPKRITTNTFGANIHELLADSFFMSHTTGEYANKKIDELISFYSEVRDAVISDSDKSKLKLDYKEHLEAYNFVVSNIGEDVIRHLLQNHLDFIAENLTD